MRVIFFFRDEGHLIFENVYKVMWSSKVPKKSKNKFVVFEINAS